MSKTMFFTDEPEWMRKARTVPLHSTWESRQPADPKPTPASNTEALKSRTMS